MHVVQFLFDLRLLEEFEGVVLRALELGAFAALLKVRTWLLAVPLPNSHARSALPLVHEAAELFRDRKPDDRVHVIGHDHESDALRRHFLSQVVENAEQNALWLILVEELSAIGHGERHEVRIECIIDDAASWIHASHAASLTSERAPRFLAAAPHR